jgi:hypothetical protein
LDFQNSNHLHDLRHNANGQLTFSYMLAWLLAQKVDLNLREMKINCLILAWINICCFKNNWNCFLLRKNIWLFLIFSMLLVLVQKGGFIFCYTLHHIIITHWSKLICIKVTSTCYIIDIWACVV